MLRSAQTLTWPVPKTRKPKFDLTLRIIDLNNIPLVCGTCYVKWHLPSSTSAEHRGRAEKALIRDHKATWDYVKSLPVRLVIDKAQKLEECEIHFEVLQEFSEGGRGSRVILGNVKINLAEYAQGHNSPKRERDPESDIEDGIVRRHLMHESKINSTLKVGITMRQTEGDTNFIAPPLKAAMVFDGIAGIMSTEAVQVDETGHIPSITSKTRELSELQDMYRQTLAATWACQAGELPPDKLIEDLFAGGDGGAMKPPATADGPGTKKHQRGKDPTNATDINDANSKRSLKTTFVSPNLVNTGRGEGHGHRRHGTRSGSGKLDSESSSSSNGTTRSGRSSIEQQLHHSTKEHKRRDQKALKEVTEFDLREDLRSWEISAN